MTSPFPGMDPFLEGYLWPDVHSKLANVLTELLGARISPKYVARIALYTVEDTSPEEDIGILYPDVEVFLREKEKWKNPGLSPETDVLTPPSATVSWMKSVEIKIPVVEIRDRDNNQLITAIEILSPVNKRSPGLQRYREKRNDLHNAGVHLLEIDLLRRGVRPFIHPHIPLSHYLITLVRATSHKAEVWACDIADPLPVVPVPLKAPDADVPLNLGQAMRIIYERSLYELSIDYTQDAPPPSLSDEDRIWIQNH